MIWIGLPRGVSTFIIICIIIFLVYDLIGRLLTITSSVIDISVIKCNDLSELLTDTMGVVMIC